MYQILLIALFLICSLATNSALAHKSECAPWLVTNAVDGMPLKFSALRSKTDPRFSILVDQIRTSFKPGAAGYVLIPSADVFSLAEYNALYPSLPKGYQFEWAKNYDGQATTLVKPISVLAKMRHHIPDDEDEFVSDVSIPEDLLRSVVDDAHILEAAINEAQVGFEQVEIETVNIRTFARGDKVSKIHDSSDFHPDAGWMTFTLAPKGGGTLYTEEQSSNPIAVRQTPSNEGLLITNLDRAKFSGSKPTYHASEEDLGDRLLILIRFRSVK